MFFNVSQLMMEPSGSTRAYNVDEDLLAREGDGAQRYTGSARLFKTDRGVWVSLDLESEAFCTCSRCLEEYRQPVRVVIEEEFFSHFDPYTGHPRGLSDNEENFSIDANHTLDLTEAVRQYSTLNIPMQQTCREGCKGICATCGSNRNEVECQCDLAVRDSRWGVLLEMAAAETMSDIGEI